MAKITLTVEIRDLKNEQLDEVDSEVENLLEPKFGMGAVVIYEVDREEDD